MSDEEGSDNSDSFSDGSDFDHRFSSKHNEDDDFDYEDDEDVPHGSGSGAMIGLGSQDGKSKLIMNQHHDEVMDLSDSGSANDSVASDDSPTHKNSRKPDRGDSPPANLDNHSLSGDYDDEESSSPTQQHSYPTHQSTQQSIANQQASQQAQNDMRKGSAGTKPQQQQQQQQHVQQQQMQSNDSDEDDMDVHGKPENRYNPGDFANLNVSPEIRELFGFITAYKPHDIELETKLKPFIPEYIPAVGDIDPFIKIPRPDKKPDFLGLHVLDEPSSNLSDPSVIELKLRYRLKVETKAPVRVRGIENADKNPKDIQAWINSINNLHHDKPPPNVTYSKPMPDIEQLMQVWPHEFEELLQTTDLPGADLDVSLEEYVRIICGILDIPIYNNLVESLHVLFTLYSEFKTNQHFAMNQ